MLQDFIDWVLAGYFIRIQTPVEFPAHWQNLWPHHRLSDVLPVAPDLTMQLMPLRDWYSDHDTNGNWSFHVSDDGTVLATRIEHPLFVADIVKEKNGFTGIATIRENDVTSLMILVRACVAMLAAMDGRFMFHASGLVRHGKLFLFSGPSGSGKSTIVEVLNNGGQVFAVDRVLLGCDADDEKRNTVIAISTPFSDEVGAHGLMSPVPVSGIFFIEQAESERLQSLTHELFVSSLFSQVLMLKRDVKMMTQLMALSSTIWESMPVLQLLFARNEVFWKLIDSEMINARMGDLDELAFG